MSEVVGIVLAAGQGTRMRSATPKVLHKVAGRTLVACVVDAAFEAGVSRCVAVVGHAREEVTSLLSDLYGERVVTAHQADQRGTGHATQCGMSQLDGYEGKVLVLYGDCPLIPASVLSELIERGADADLALITATIDDPHGYGRILRDEQGRAIAIREHRDCSPDELAVNEVNPGLYLIDAAFLREAMASLKDDNDQGELYLTDVLAFAAERGDVVDVKGEMTTLRGVNDRAELAIVDQVMRRRIAERHARAGVGIRDLDDVWIDAQVVIAPDASIGPGVHLRGHCQIGAGAIIDVGCVLTDMRVAPDAHVLPYTVATESSIGDRAKVGPFTHLRPKTELGPDTKIGNFVETKKTRLGPGSKASHLSYLGDGEVGAGVNIGAGTIFCNYDGYQKNVTTLEDGVFIGSDSQLVAPLTIGKGAYVASGTTVTRDVPADALALSRTKQENKLGYAARLRARLEAMKKSKAKK